MALLKTTKLTLFMLFTYKQQLRHIDVFKVGHGEGLFRLEGLAVQAWLPP